MSSDDEAMRTEVLAEDNAANDRLGLCPGPLILPPELIFYFAEVSHGENETLQINAGAQARCERAWRPRRRRLRAPRRNSRRPPYVVSQRIWEKRRHGNLLRWGLFDTLEKATEGTAKWRTKSAFFLKIGMEVSIGMMSEAGDVWRNGC